MSLTGLVIATGNQSVTSGENLIWLYVNQAQLQYSSRHFCLLPGLRTSPLFDGEAVPKRACSRLWGPHDHARSLFIAVKPDRV